MFANSLTQHIKVFFHSFRSKMSSFIIKMTDIRESQKSVISRPYSVKFCDLIAIRLHFSIDLTTDTTETDSTLCQTTNTLGTSNHLLYLGYKQFEHIRHPTCVQFIYQKYGWLQTAFCYILYFILLF